MKALLHSLFDPAVNPQSPLLGATVLDAGTSVAPAPLEVVFIDSRVTHSELLLLDLPANARVFTLEASEDGLAQIDIALEQLAAEGSAPVAAIHLVSHGSSGHAILGATHLTAENLADHADLLAKIGTQVAADADFLFYGCSVGAGERGTAFVDAFAAHTGMDVAASNDATGSAYLGGDWNLEVIRGTVSGTSPTTTTFTPSALSPAGVVADQFKGRIIVFDNDTTTAALRGQATDITANTGAALPLFTFTSLTTAPSAGDTFSIL